MEITFKGKVALVTGAASGMGLASAMAFADAGASVALVDRDRNAVERAAQEITQKGQKALAFVCDVANETEVKETIEEVVRSLGRIDAAFNNAGVQSPALETADLNGEEYDRILGINLRGVFNFMKYELQHMREQGSGTIVNNSSLGGLVGLPGRAAYHASKHGVLGLTKSSALEYATRGIRINAICPGIIETPMVRGMLEQEAAAMKEYMRDVPINRLGKPEEVADVVLWLSSRYATYVIGQAIAVDGGYTVH